VLRTIARTLLWPIRRFFDPRFLGVVDRVDALRDEQRTAMVVHQETQSEVNQLQGLIHADMEATSEAVTLIGRSLRGIESMVEEVSRQGRSYQLAARTIEQVDSEVARLLNYANSDSGFAAQEGVWFNPPVLVEYDVGKATVRHVNERIAEVPFAFQALARVPSGAELADVGASESTLCLSLATAGYRVTAIDPRPNPLSHPNLTVVLGKVEEWDDDRSFQATICLSTIEHIGVGAYEQDDSDQRADLNAMSRIRELTEVGGLLVLTTSYGPKRVDEFSRTYDRAGLDELLEGWDVEKRSLLARQDDTTWVSLDPATEPHELEDREAVVMIAATRMS
jgi:hypothetical protein